MSGCCKAGIATEARGNRASDANQSVYQMACLLAIGGSLFVAGLAGGVAHAKEATPARSVDDLGFASTSADRPTCAFNRAGRKLGCLELGGECNIFVWGRMSSGWLWAIEGFSTPADMNAQPLNRGTWRIRFWRDRDLAGFVQAINGSWTAWRITSPRGKLVAFGRGPEGPALAMVLLGWGPTCLK